MLAASLLPAAAQARAGAGEPAAQARTNLIAIVTDDQAQWAVGCYGNRDLHTPHLDRLAREGALFENALVITPVCSPSRATYLTGRYPSELGITDYISPDEDRRGLGLAAPVWPEVLQAAGYRTGLVGKWHLGSQSQFHPRRHGFDEFAGFLGGAVRPNDSQWEIDGRPQRGSGPTADLLIEPALDFVRRHRDRPFALLLHFREPHLPYPPVRPEDEAPYRDKSLALPDEPGLDRRRLLDETRGYYAAITCVDRNVGRLLDLLDELDLAGKTAVVFTSDHGYNLGRHLVDTKGNAQWIAGGIRGPKRPNMWETSLRVPLLVRLPGRIAPGTRIDYPLTNLDTYRTMLGLLEVATPDDCQARGVDGSPLLTGGRLPPPAAIFGQYDLHNLGLAYLRMIRTPRYKFVKHCYSQGLDELYDLAADPGERINLLGGGREPPQELAQLERQLLAWQQSIGDPVLAPAPRGD